MVRGKSIGIRELIDCLNMELTRHTTPDSFFTLNKIEMEIAFTVERDMNGQLDFRVVNTNSVNSGANVQVVKVTLGANEHFYSVPGQLVPNHTDVLYK